MRWILATLASFLLATCIPGIAQQTHRSGQDRSASDPYTGQSSPNSNGQYSQNGTYNSQSSTSTQSHSYSQSSGEQSMEGCIVRQDTYYYLQPENGGAPIRLNSSDDVRSNEGHQVKIQGTQQQASQSTSSTTSSPNQDESTRTSEAQSNVGPQSFEVSRVDVIAQTCPAGSTNNDMK